MPTIDPPPLLDTEVIHRAYERWASIARRSASGSPLLRALRPVLSFGVWTARNDRGPGSWTIRDWRGRIRARSFRHGNADCVVLISARGQVHMQLHMDERRLVWVEIHHYRGDERIETLRYESNMLVSSWQRRGSDRAADQGGWEKGRRVGTWWLHDDVGVLSLERSGGYADGVRIRAPRIEEALSFPLRMEDRRRLAAELAARVLELDLAAAAREPRYSSSATWPILKALFALATHDDDEVRNGVGPAAGRAIVGIGADAMSKRMRFGPPYVAREVSDVAARALLQRIELTSGSSVAEAPLAVIACFSWSPLIRAAAVRRLCRCTAGDELPFLMFCTVDESAEVAQLALEGLRERAQASNARAFADAFPAMLALTCRYGGRASACSRALDPFWRTQEGARRLLASFASYASSRVREAALRIVLEVDTTRRAAIERGLVDPNARVRAMAARAAIETTDEAALESVARRMVRDDDPTVRALGYRTSWERLPRERQLPTDAGLLDSSRRLRALALRHARELDAEFNPRAFYSSAVAAPATNARRGAWMGFAEHATVEDADVLADRVNDGSVPSKSGALQVVARVGSRRQAVLLLRCLAQPSSSSSTRRALESAGRTLDAGELADLLRSTGSEHVATNVLRLHHTLAAWDAAFVILTACQRAEPKLRERALASLVQWMKRMRSGSSPTNAARMASIGAVLAQVERSLDGAVRNELLALFRASS